MPITKPTSYYRVARTDMAPLLPDPLGRVLDVGCGTGATGRLLRERRPEALVGIEIHPESGRIARTTYDEVFIGPVEEILGQLHESFDTILCYDVLEHLVDPWSVLAQLAGVSNPGARLHVSVPNARHLSLTFDLLFRGTFGYRQDGHRDNTHLRWFTPRDLERAIAEAGFEVRSRSHPRISAARRTLARISGGRSTEFLVGQWQVLAVRQAMTPGPSAGR